MEIRSIYYYYYVITCAIDFKFWDFLFRDSMYLLLCVHIYIWNNHVNLLYLFLLHYITNRMHTQVYASILTTIVESMLGHYHDKN